MHPLLKKILDPPLHFYSEDDYPQVAETSVTVNNDSPIQDYVHQDDQTQPTLWNDSQAQTFHIAIAVYNKKLIR